MTLYITLSIINGHATFQAVKKNENDEVIDNKIFYAPVSEISILQHVGNTAFINFGRKYYIVPTDCTDIIIDNSGGNSPAGVGEYLATQLGYPV